MAHKIRALQGILKGAYFLASRLQIICLSAISLPTAPFESGRVVARSAVAKAKARIWGRCMVIGV